MTSALVEKTHSLYRELRGLRRGSGLSLEQVERLHGVSRVRLGSYERGDRECTVTFFDRLLRMFGCRLAIVPADLSIEAIVTENAELREFQRRILAGLAQSGAVSATDDAGRVG